MITDMNQLKKQPTLVELLKLLMANQNRHMSTLDLLGSGILSAASGIARLKDRGVVFETIYQTIADKGGRDHKNVACYKIVGGVVL
jgi:hypothetical protein